MDARTWLGLEPSHNPHRWHLPVSKGISTGHRAMFGGSGLGAAIAPWRVQATDPLFGRQLNTFCSLKLGPS